MLTQFKCINCQTSYDETALYCAQCGEILPHAFEGGLEATRSITAQHADGENLQWGTSYFHHRARLFLHMHDLDVVLPVKLDKGQAVIGRSSSQQVDVDLTPFGAVDLGVSRRHILIERVRDVLQVTDLESNNGTHLNRERLAPNTPYTLRNRAVLELGKLILRVQYM
jgi:hypothetical protein